MSRTYRDVNRAKAKRLLNGYWAARVPGMGNQMPVTDHLWNPMRTAPSWWIREFMTVPQRARTRRLLSIVLRMRIDELDDAPIFPHSKRPHIYYW